MKNDVFENARTAITSDLIRSYFDSPGSYVDNNEYFILSPLRSDKKVGSFHINLDTGIYFDHATNEGGDFIELVSKAKNLSLKEAAEDIVKSAGGIIDNPEQSKKPPKKKQPDKKLPTPIFPIKNETKAKKSIIKLVTEEWTTKKWGQAVKIYQYRNIDNEWLFSVCRFEKKTGGKNAIPFYYTDDDKWYAKAHDIFKPYQPFGIEKIKDNDLPNIIVEGEPCGQCEIHGYNVLSWFGGTQRVGQTDWKILEGRKNIIWPDADSQKDNEGVLFPEYKQPGMKAALKIKSELPSAVILDIYKMLPMENNPDGWDVVDCITEGVDPLQVIKDCTPDKNIMVSVDSYDMFGKFIELFYDKNSLEQNAGVYWHYPENLHYWRTVRSGDIECNMQRWLEATKLHWLIASKVKPTKFFNEMRQYLKHFSSGYINENPYKNSSLKPFLHVKNGALEISRSDIQFHNRDEKKEDFFKMLYPINCLDFDFNTNHFNNIDMEKDCPAYNFYINGLIPKDLKETLSEKKYQSEVDKTIMMFSQVFAYSLIPIKPNEYFFGLRGPQNTGKSFFIKLLKSLVGAEFCVERRIKDMDNQFTGANFWGKKVFIEPDLKTRHPLPEDFIKAYAGEQEVSVEFKNKDTIHGVKTSLALFFISNYDFVVKGVEGVERRFIIIHYKNKLVKSDRSLLDKIIGKFPKGKESGEYEGKTFDERPAILGLAMAGWKEFCNNNFEFTLPAWTKKEKELWVNEADAIKNFYSDHYIDTGIIGTYNRTEIYDAYKKWSDSEGKNAFGKKNFYKEFRKIETVKEIETSRQFIITAIDEDGQFEIEDYGDDVPI